MGLNLTEKALQKSFWSVTCIHTICKQYDKQSGVPVSTTAHSTKFDATDIRLVTEAVLTNELLNIIPERHHRAFKVVRLNPI